MPKYDWWYLPLLELLSDGKVHRMADLYDSLANKADLTAADLSELLPSGTDHTYRNRIAWARTFLKKAGLVESPGRGRVCITERGKTDLARHPGTIDNKWLSQYPEFAAWNKGSKPESVGQPSDAAPAEETPREQLERLHGEMQHDLADELLSRVRTARPSFFERIVVDVMLAMGYGGSREDAGRTVGRAGDGGIDGVIDEDRLGLDKIYLQAKRWEGNVGRPVVQGFAGAMAGFHAVKGVMITTSSFTDEARQFVGNLGQKIVLIDGRQLADFMIQFGVGVGVEATYVLKRIDSDYFDPD